MLCAIVATLALVCIFAFVGLRSDDPARFAPVYANIALYLGTVMGGGISSRQSDSPFVCALICGVTCAILVLLPSIILSDWGAESLLRLVFTVVAAIVGAFIFRQKEGGAARKQSAKRRRAIAKKYGGA